MTIRFPACLAVVLALCGCQNAAALREPDVTRTLQEAPPGAPPGTCWGKQTTPAMVETVTEQILLKPAQIRTDGTVTQPATYKTETRQAIVRERKVTWFRVPCAYQQPADFVASLQRALKVRGHYTGPVSGQMDARTRSAVRAYQKPQGLESDILSLAAARKLGLVAVDRQEDS